MNLFFNSKKRHGFTLIELLVTMVICFLLSTLFLSGLAKAKIKSPAVGCQSNLRQLMIGWELYRNDNSDYLIPDEVLGGGGGTATATKSWAGNSTENWAANAANTNPAVYLSTIFAPYINNDISIFKCPSDIVPSANGQRLRSYSMNGQIGVGTFNYSDRKLFNKMSDFSCPGPLTTFVFCDESPASINDSYLQVAPTTQAAFPDIPACYLDGACGFSFADGHAEIHKWTTTSLLVPVVVGYTTAYPPLSSGNNNSDWIWFSARAGCVNQ